MTPLLEAILSAASPRKALQGDARLEIEAERLAAPLPPLRAAAARARESVEQGAHGRRRAGGGESFWQFRRFQEGDFRSDIDWRASARHEHLHVREREKESPVRFRLWWDAAAGMDYRSRSGLPLKRERAAVLMLALARLLRRGGESVELLPGHAAPSLPASGGACHFVLASDFLHPPEPLLAALAGKAQGHLLHIVDPAEEQFPFRGRIGFMDAAGAVRQLLGNAEDCAGEYRRRFDAHAAALAAAARKCGWSMLRHRTDADARDALLGLHRRLSLPAARPGARDATLARPA